MNRLLVQERKGRSWALGLALLTMIAACGGSSGTATTNAPITLTIGVPIDLTGAAGFAGIEAQNAMNVLVADTNKAGKVQVTLQIQDTKSTPSTAVSVVDSMLPNVDAIVGITVTQNGQAVMPKLVQSGKTIILQQVSDLTGRDNQIFSMTPPRKVMVQGLVNYLKAQGIKSVGLIWDNQPTLAGDKDNFLNAANTAGIKITDSEGASTTQSDFSAQITKILSTNPDAIGTFAFPAQSGSIVSQLRGLKYSGTLFGQQGDSSSAFYKVAGTAADKYRLFAYWDNSAATGKGATFLAEYKAAYPSSPLPSFAGMLAWDSLNIYIAAVEAVGSADPKKVATYLSKTSFNAGVENPMRFGSDGFATVHGYLLQYNADGTKQMLQNLGKSTG
jgi:branched-chain amino acid transport system substrate-binding protein